MSYVLIFRRVDLYGYICYKRWDVGEWGWGNAKNTDYTARQ